MSAEFTDAQLAAFLDGTLADESLAAAIEAAINADPALAERAMALAEGADDAAARSVRDAYAPVLEAPVPAHLTQTLAAPGGGDIVNLADRRDQARALSQPANDTGTGWRWPQFAAVAASLVVGVMIGGPLLGPGGAGLGTDGGSLVLASSEVSAMLDAAPSGQRQDLAALGEGEVVLTFRNTDGALCRQFMIAAPDGGTSDALACAGQDGDWQIEAFGRRAAPVGEMKLAGGDAAVGVVAAVDEQIAGDPLVGPEELAELRRK
jgi:surface antigen